MSKPNEFSPEDLLERSLAEMRREALPDGPPDQLVARTLEALKSAEGGAPTTLKLNTQGNKTMRFLMKLAAVIALVSGIAAMLFIANHTTSVALGDVVNKIRDAHTMTCSATVESPADAKHPMTMKMYINQAFRMRIESQTGAVQIFDHAAGKILMLDVNTKQATVASTGAGRPAAAGAGGWIGAIKSLNVKDSKDLGEKEIDGRKAKGFLVNKEGTQFILWADPVTGDPILISVEIPMSGKFIKVVMSDFVIDGTLDDSLFSTDPPEGYTVRNVDASQTISEMKKYNDEEHAVIALRTYAESSDGNFPAKLDDYAAYAKLATTKPTSPYEMTPAMHGAMLMPFLMKVGKGNWAYHADDVKLGDKDALVFWYLDPKTQKYRGVFGDLEAREMSKKEIEEKSASWKAEATTLP
jgi:outer membrane lipoprotein-sorting protein